MSSSAFSVTGSSEGTGTVTFVGATSSDLTITGSPITTTGTLDFTLNTVTVAKGGTGRTTATAYALLCGGTTATGAHQSIASVGTAGQVLTSNGAAALPTFQNATGSGTVNSGATNDLAYYAGAGTTISPVVAAASSVLITSAGSVPSLSQTLPSAVQLNITSVGTVTAGTWSATTIATTVGGTGLTTYTQGDLIYSSAANTLAKLAKDINTTRYLSNQGTSNNPSWNQVNLANGVTNNLPVTNLNGGSGASGATYWRGDGTWAAVSGSVSADITQASHGFVAGQWLYINAGTGLYTLAIATSAAAAEVVGVVSAVIGVNSFTLLVAGNSGAIFTGLTNAVVYFLSTTVAGAMQTAEPSTIGEISKPLLVANSTTSGWIVNYRGDELTNVEVGETYELISSATASSSASIEFTGLSSDYFSYMVILSDVVPGTDTADFIMRTSANNGSSYDAGASDYAYCRFTIQLSAAASAPTGTGDDADSSILLKNAVGTGSNEATSGQITIYNPSAATYTRILGDLNTTDSTPTNLQSRNGALRLSAAAVDAIQFLMSSGNIASGTFKLYGIKA